MNDSIYRHIYKEVGGDEFFQNLVETFYTKIENDSILRPIFPANLASGKRWQYLFLRQFFGGPREYEKIRGHPRLRKRHLPFPIGIRERNQWVKLMFESLNEVGISKDHKFRSIFEEYFNRTATKMMNQSSQNEVVSFSSDLLK